ncbi:MAG: 50S ribosomal protein L6, partial [Polaribacter sp.]
MSRIGKNPVSISQGVDVNIKDNVVTVKGKLGELSQTISNGITVKIEDGIITLDRTSESKN